MTDEFDAEYLNSCKDDLKSEIHNVLASKLVKDTTEK